MIEVAVLPGDGVGPEVLRGPRLVLEGLERDGVVEVTGPWPVGAAAAHDEGSYLPEATLDACAGADAILLGAVGDDPRVPPNVCSRPELALLELRRRFDLRVSIRQVPSGGGRTLWVVRNLQGGAYGGPKDRGEADDDAASAWDRIHLDRARIEEVVGLAVDLLRRKDDTRLVSVDKANLFATSRLWRRIATTTAYRLGEPIEHRLIDRAAAQLAGGEIAPDVLVTEGLFGDILSDVAAAAAGSPALCGSASVRPDPGPGGGCVGLFEPAHGSAPRRAGRDQIDPLGGYLALSSLLSWFPATALLGERLNRAIGAVLEHGPWTYDLVRDDRPPASTSQVDEAVLAAFGEAATSAADAARHRP